MGSLTWSTSDIPDLEGKVYIVTGGNSGLGYETALELTRHHAHVIIATHAQNPSAPMPQDEIDGPGAVSNIRAEVPNANVEYMELDLSSFRSINRFAEVFKSKGLPLHCLINNAGLQTPPDATTEDGFEIELGINFWGHFFLTQLLLPLLKSSSMKGGGSQAGPGAHTSSRIVWVSSPAETIGETDWDDLRGTKRGTNMKTYGTSKLWMLMVSMEMNDRLKGSGVESFACHPGLSRTDIFRKADHEKWASIITDWAQWLSGQTAASGALSILYCATAPELEGKGGTFYGPYHQGPVVFNVFNTQQRTPGNPEAHDPEMRKRLYDEASRVVEEVSSRLETDAGTTAAVGDTPTTTTTTTATATTTTEHPQAGLTQAATADNAEGDKSEGPGLESVQHLKDALEEVGIVLTGPPGVSRTSPEELAQLGKAAKEEAKQQGRPVAAAPAGVEADV